MTIGGHEEVRPILTAPNKSLPSGLKLHQKNNGMEARRRRGERAVRGSGWSTVSAMSKPMELGMLTASSHYGSHAVVATSGCHRKPARVAIRKVHVGEIQQCRSEQVRTLSICRW